MKVGVSTTLLFLFGFGFATSAQATPAYPGAYRRTDPTGRWYVAVEERSDRCALVERAPNSPPLPEFWDGGGANRYGMPGPDPIQPGDRIVVRARIHGYPYGSLPASDGSGFAAITQDYGPPGFPKGKIVELLNWVPASGPRVVFVLPEAAPPKMIAYGPAWGLRRIAHETGLVVLQEWDGRFAVLRVADGALRFYSKEQESSALAAVRVFDSPPRSPPEFGTDAQSKIRALAAMRGEPVLGLSPFERVPIVVRAFDVLGADAGESLLRFFEGEERTIVDPERNVVRAAYWTLLAHPEGVTLARKALADHSRPAEVRAVCAWILSESLAKGDFRPLTDSIADANPNVSAAVAAALFDRRWDAGPEFLRLLDAAGGQEAVVADFFEAHVIDRSVPGLLRALRRAPPGSPLRLTFAKALQTQTMLSDVGDDPAAWERALPTMRPK